MVEVVQVAYEIPTAIKVGIEAGQLVQYGSVVRDLGGHIVKHLKTVPIPKKAKEGVAEIAGKIVEKIKNPKVAGLLVGGALVAGAGIYAYNKFIKKDNIEVPECIIKFNDNLKEYLLSIKNNNNNIEVINNLLNSLDVINKEDINYTLQINIKDFKEIMALIKDYTEKFAKANDYKYDKTKYKTDNIIYLKDYLEVQKNILKKVA